MDKGRAIIPNEADVLYELSLSFPYPFSLGPSRKEGLRLCIVINLTVNATSQIFATGAFCRRINLNCVNIADSDIFSASGGATRQILYLVDHKVKATERNMH